MSEKMRDAIVSELRHTAGKLIDGEISDGDIAASLLSEAAELLASSPAQESVTTEPEDIVWSRVNSEPFEYAIQQGPHGDEFVKLINGKCLKRSCAPLLAIPAPPQLGQEWREWRQIETAPKNGTFVDLLFRGNVRIADCIWYRDAWWATEQRDPSVCVSHGLAQPTHWMPIPTPATLTGEPK